MTIEKLYYVNTGRDGILGDTGEADVRALAEAAVAAGRIVIHVHGGLVPKDKALAKAAELQPVYQAAGAHPVFFVWEAGLLEILSHNLGAIAREALFETLVGKVLQHTVGKLRDAGPAKSVTGAVPLPTKIELGIELNKRQAGLEPFGALAPSPDLEELTSAQRDRFERELLADAAFRAEVEAIARSLKPRRELTDAKGLALGETRSSTTLLAPQVVEEISADFKEAASKGTKGLLSTAKLVVRAGRVLHHVVSRLRHGRGHGLYVTVVEEILRELYLPNVGAPLWNQMKQETADTFENAARPPARGGWLFVRELGRAIEGAGTRPQVSVVGHSTGAVFICHLLRHLAEARQDPNHPLPADFRLENVVFLAPAVTCSLFAESLEHHRDLFANFRMFTMRDAAETQDVLVPVIYPHSLLYFVSGLTEREADGSGAFDLPLVGMERYLRDEGGTYTTPEVVALRAFLAEDPRRVVWSPADDGAGRASNALSHVDFDELTNKKGEVLTTLQSLQHLLTHGA